MVFFPERGELVYSFTIQENGASQRKTVIGIYYEYKVSVNRALLWMNNLYFISLFKHKL